MEHNTTKAQFIERISSAFHKLDAELDSVDPESCRTKEIEGDISVCDLLAYQIGWGRLLLSWEAAEKRGEAPVLPAVGYKWNQLKQLAASFYDAHQEISLDQLRYDLGEVVKEVLFMISRLTDTELFQTHKRQWTGDKWPLSKWIQVNTAAPYEAARKKIRKWKKQKFNKVSGIFS